MYKVLVFGMTENPGGVESVIMNYWHHIDKSLVHFDFLINSYNTIAYERELVSDGCMLYKFPARRKNLLLYRKELVKFFKNHASEYDAIWVNICTLSNIDYLILAKRYGISKRIIHSHNSRNMNGFIQGVLHKINKVFVSRYATNFWACSEESGKYFYKKSLLSKVVIINNAIDLKKFHYDVAARRRIRQELGWDSCYIIGNIGRLHFQKNQAFAIDIFNELSKTDNRARLVLVGQGEDESMLKGKIKSLELQGKCYFAGLQTNINDWLSCFDLFLFPSLFEGLALAPLEAQATGLTCLLSENIFSKDVQVNKNVFALSLNSPIRAWVEHIKQLMNSSNPRTEESEILNSFIEHRYEIESESKHFQDLLLGCK